MTGYQFSFQLVNNPDTLTRSIELGAECTLADLADALNEAIGLPDESKWRFLTSTALFLPEMRFGLSSETTHPPAEYASPDFYPPSGITGPETALRYAKTVPIETFVLELGLVQGDKLLYTLSRPSCTVSQWNFHCQLKATFEDFPPSSTPEVIEGSGASFDSANPFSARFRFSEDLLE